MTNPDNIVRVRARNGGRASVYEANGWAQAYSDGLLEGNGVVQNTSADMGVLVGGSTTKPDVVLAKNPAGYKIALDLIGQQLVTLTAPASNSRISAIVAYTDDLSLSTDETSVTGSPSSCGLIVVNGTAAASPSAPTDAQIRSAITSDGATGSQASYAIIATVEVASSTTIITSELIKNNEAKINSDKIDFTTYPIVSTATDSVGLGYGYNATLIRVGNIVTLTSWQKFTQNPVDAQILSETIPLGYRPSFSVRPAQFFIDGSSNRKVTWQFRQNGSMTIYTNAQANDTVLIYTTWVTNDPMP